MPTVHASSTSDLLSSITGLLWPVLAAVVLVVVGRRLLPVLGDILQSRAFTLKVGPFELTAQKASDQLQRTVEDLRTQVGTLGSQVAELSTGAAAPAAAATLETTDEELVQTARAGFSQVLWVDDHPENNAFEVAALERRGVMVDLTKTTADALDLFRRKAYDVVVTDLGRTEDERYVPDAGIRLVRQLREVDPNLAIFIYTLDEAVLKYRERALEAGANAITGSSAALLELLLQRGGTFAMQFQKTLSRWLSRLELASSEELRTAQDAGVDFLVRDGDQKVVIEAKAWQGSVPVSAIRTAAGQVQAAAQQLGADRAVVVTPAYIDVPAKVREATPSVEFLSLDALQQHLGE